MTEPPGSASGFSPRGWWSRARAHLAFMLLLALLAWHGATSFGVYLHRDDFRWLHRTVADSSRPWNIFVEPLFSNYYRPVAHAIWLLDYYLWGFQFGGYQFNLVAIWLGGIILTYVVGTRLNGPLAGFVAAALLGLNNVHLMMVTWKSWVISLTEILLLLGWCTCFLSWVDGGRRARLAAWLALAALATLTKESAPLIVSAAFLVCVVARGEAPPPGGPGSSPLARRRWLLLTVWFAATGAVLLLLPSYRATLLGLVRGASPPAGAPREFSTGYVWRNWCSHTASIFGRGIPIYLLLFAVLWALWSRLGIARARPRRYATAFIGALTAGAVLLALPATVASHPLTAAALGKETAASLADHAGGVAAAIALTAFVVAALAGDLRDRLLGAWFAAAMAPILPFRLASNGYHMLAFVALSLYIGRHVAGFVETEGSLAWRRIRRRTGGDGQDLPRFLALAALVSLLGWTIWLLAGNLRFVHRERPPEALRGRPVATLPMYVERGREWRRRVEDAVAATLRDMAPARVAFVGDGDLEGVAALHLASRSGVRVVRLRDLSADVVALRRFASPLRIYTDAIRYDAALFARCGNLLADPGFEGTLPDTMRGEVARSGRFSLALRAGAEKAETRAVSSEPLPVQPGAALVFGGFLRCDAAGLERATMALEFHGERLRTVRAPGIDRPDGTWHLVCECAVPPPDASRLVFRSIEAVGLRDGSVYADDVFLCPVEPLIQEARLGGAEERLPASGYRSSPGVGN